MMRRMANVFSPVLVLWFAAGAVGETDATIPFEAALDDANVTLTSMADGHRESLIVGNGDLYGIVWEDNGGLTMRVTKNDIWDARVDTSEDPPLPKVDVSAGTVSGATSAPPSYKHLYPQPRCAAVIRLGTATPADGVQWTCIRAAGEHQFESTADQSSATMQVAGAAGVSTGYRATLTNPADASTLHLKLTGSDNALYYVNIYDAAGKNILGCNIFKP